MKRRNSMYYDSTSVYGPRRPGFNADSIPAKALVGSALANIGDFAREMADKYQSVLDSGDSLQARAGYWGRNIYTEEVYVDHFKSILFFSCERKRKNQAAHIAAVRELIAKNNEEWIPDFDKKFG